MVKVSPGATANGSGFSSASVNAPSQLLTVRRNVALAPEVKTIWPS
jgi:hypothetical protein